MDKLFLFELIVFSSFVGIVDDDESFNEDNC